MSSNRIYRYYVEGPDEEKLINVLKSDMKLIYSGRVEVINVVQKKLTELRLMQLKSNTVVVLIFDTDAGNVEILNYNIKLLNKCQQVKKIICIPQVGNLEDELIRSCDIRQIKELLDSQSNKDFKHDLIKEKNLALKLQGKNFDINRLWSNNPSNQYKDVKNNSREILVPEAGK